MSTITLLRGLEWYARGTKSFAYNEQKEIVKTSDFKLGYKFSFELVEIDSLVEFVDLIRKIGSESTIRVHGVPRPEKQFLGLPIERSKKYLVEPENGITLFNLDIDDWPCQDFSYHYPETGSAAVLQALSDRGFSFLCEYDFALLWTQSAWKTNRLRCHLYFLLDSPIPLSKLRAWASSVNRSRSEKILDGSVWSIAQPDYIGRRQVEAPLVDPLSEEERVFFVKRSSRLLNSELLLSEINKETPYDKESITKGNAWQSTIGSTGTPGNPEGDINSWGFRAAAQLVAEYGPNYVRRNIKALADDLHSRAWEAIDNLGASENGRGGESDRETYNVERYEQYLRSACDRGFGSEIDNRIARVRDAIGLAKETGDFKDLFSKGTLEECAEISKSRPAAWAEIQTEIKEKLRGKVSITEFRKLVKKKSRGGLEPEGSFDEGRVKLIRKVLGEFDWIYDDDDNRYVGRIIKDKFRFPESYELRTLSDNLADIFYHIGAQKDETVTPHFGKSCLAYLLGSLHGGAPDKEKNKWVKKTVGQQQVLTEDNALWWYLNPRNSLRILKNEISQISSDLGVDNEVLWYSQQTVKDRDIIIRDSEDISLLWKYILCNKEDRPQVIGWLVSCLTDAKMQMVLELIGASGSAKSSAGNALRDLIEPVSSNPFHFNPKERLSLKGLTRQDKYRVLKKNAVINLDNISGLDAETQDFYCQITTGICVDLRILYSSTLESIPIKRPIILSSINSNITQPDLLSRSLRAYFSNKPEDLKNALPESELPDSWERDRPLILGALAQICSKVLKLREKAKGRRGVYTSIMEAVYGSAIGKEVAKKDYRRAQTDTIITNPFCLVFTAFVLDTYEGISIVETPSALHLNYKRWTEDHWGEYFVVPLLCGERVEVQVMKNGGQGSGFLPSSPRGLGILFNKFKHELKDICGIEIGEITKNNGVRVRTIRKIMLL